MGINYLDIDCRVYSFIIRGGRAMMADFILGGPATHLEWLSLTLTPIASMRSTAEVVGY